MMIKKWYYTATLLVLYVATFLVWQRFASRAVFVVVGLGAAAVMLAGLLAAARRGYFADRRDAFLHLLVIADVALEATAYEAFQAAMGLGPDQSEMVIAFHAGNTFYGCAAAFALLVGGYHGWALVRNRKDAAMSSSAT